MIPMSAVPVVKALQRCGGFSDCGFVRSGWINLPNTAGTFRNAGAEGVWWSSRAYSSNTNAYDLYLQTTGVVSPSNNSNRYNGFSLRCLLCSRGGCRSFYTFPKNLRYLVLASSTCFVSSSTNLAVRTCVCSGVSFAGKFSSKSKSECW